MQITQLPRPVIARAAKFTLLATIMIMMSAMIAATLPGSIVIVTSAMTLLGKIVAITCASIDENSMRDLTGRR